MDFEGAQILSLSKNDDFFHFSEYPFLCFLVRIELTRKGIQKFPGREKRPDSPPLILLPMFDAGTKQPCSAPR